MAIPITVPSVTSPDDPASGTDLGYDGLRHACQVAIEKNSGFKRGCCFFKPISGYHLIPCDIKARRARRRAFV